MRRSQFADLVGVSKQQVGKYVGDGAVVLDGAMVDVGESLARLEGRLDEAKRLKALSLWSGRASAVPKPSAGAPLRTMTGKARHDEARAELAELELSRRKGELLEYSDVSARADEAVQALRETMAAARREDADKICAKFGLSSEKATALSRELAARDDRALARFSKMMAVLASEDDRAEDEMAA